MSCPNLKLDQTNQRRESALCWAETRVNLLGPPAGRSLPLQRVEVGGRGGESSCRQNNRNLNSSLNLFRSWCLDRIIVDTYKWSPLPLHLSEAVEVLWLWRHTKTSCISTKLALTAFPPPSQQVPKSEIVKKATSWNYGFDLTVGGCFSYLLQVTFKKFFASEKYYQSQVDSKVDSKVDSIKGGFLPQSPPGFFQPCLHVQGALDLFKPNFGKKIFSQKGKPVQMKIL